MNTIFHHSASITTKLTSQSHRLSQTGDYATSRWWPIEFPAKTFLSSISLSLFALFSHVVAEGKEEEENMREKGEANPIMRDHHQNPMSTWVPPKDPTSQYHHTGSQGWTQFTPQQLCIAQQLSVFKIKTDHHFILSFTPYSFFLKYFREQMNISPNVHNEYLWQNDRI